MIVVKSSKSRKRSYTSCPVFIFNRHCEFGVLGNIIILFFKAQRLYEVFNTPFLKSGKRPLEKDSPTKGLCLI